MLIDFGTAIPLNLPFMEQRCSGRGTATTDTCTGDERGQVQAACTRTRARAWPMCHLMLTLATYGAQKHMIDDMESAIYVLLNVLFPLVWTRDDRTQLMNMSSGQVACGQSPLLREKFFDTEIGAS